MDFDSFMAQAWDDHAADAESVAQRLSEQGVALLSSESQLVQLMNLSHHLWGAHLHNAACGTASFGALMTSAHFVPHAESAATASRCMASLSLTESADFSLAALSPSDQIRVLAMAAANLADVNAARGTQLLQAALYQAERSGLPVADPMNRALAVAGHNLAAALEEKSSLSADEIALMWMAAKASRVYWERAGTWLQVERAEYQLATTFLKAGDLVQAEFHARECGRIVTENKAPALEKFFAAEALARVMRASKNKAAFSAASEQARTVFDGLAADDKAWCEGSLKKLGLN